MTDISTETAIELDGLNAMQEAECLLESLEDLVRADLSPDGQVVIAPVGEERLSDLHRMKKTLNRNGTGGLAMEVEVRLHHGDAGGDEP